MQDIFIGGKVGEIDKRLLSYKAANEMTRLPRGLEREQKHFKRIALVQYSIHSFWSDESRFKTVTIVNSGWPHKEPCRMPRGWKCKENGQVQYTILQDKMQNQRTRAGSRYPFWFFSHLHFYSVLHKRDPYDFTSTSHILVSVYQELCTLYCAIKWLGCFKCMLKYFY